MKILVNQVGYAPSTRSEPARCPVILQGKEDEDFPEKIVLRDEEGRPLGAFPLGPEVTVAGWRGRKYRQVLVLANVGGPYVLIADNGETLTASAPFRVIPNLEVESLLSDVLFGIAAYRSAGVSDRRDRSVPFFGERKGRVDVHGGWYDASGDTSKYLSHLSYANFMNPQQTPLVVWCLADAREHLKNTPFKLGDRLSLRLQEEAAVGADFLMRMLDPAGYFYMTIFDVWSKDLDARKICAYTTQEGILTEDYPAGFRQGGGMAIAALARCASAVEPGIGEFTGEAYRDAALRGWRHLLEHNTEYLDDGKENIIDDTCALIAAVELHAVLPGGSDAEDARQEAVQRAQRLANRWDEEAGCFRADEEGDWSWFHASDEGLPVIALIRALETGVLNGGGAQRASHVVKRAIAAEVDRAQEVSNPFLHPRRLVRMPGREPETRFFYPHDNPSGYWWQGENARLASWAAAIRRARNSLSFEGVSKPRHDEFADAQVSWILGLNPFDACMLQGHGRNNPAYEWDHFNVPGGVSNGITSGLTDEDDIAFMPPEAAGKGDQSWRWGEQWIPHAAWLLLAVAWSVPVEESGR